MLRKTVKCSWRNGRRSEEIPASGTDIDRSLVYIKKIKPTSGKFPRKAGLPSKEPVE